MTECIGELTLTGKVKPAGESIALTASRRNPAWVVVDAVIQTCKGVEVRWTLL